MISWAMAYTFASENNTLTNVPEQIKPTAHFSNDLGLDSLDTVEVVMAIEEEFSIEIPDKDADGIHSGKSIPQIRPRVSTHLPASCARNAEVHHRSSQWLISNPILVDKAVEYILSQPDAN